MPGSLEIYARMLSTETGALLDARDVYAQDMGMAQLKHMTGGLALKFKHSFPLLDGTVIKVSGPSVYVDFGQAQNLKRDMKLIVFREGEKIIHPVSGRFLGRDTEELGIATVVNVFATMSLGRLSDAADGSRIRVQDLIVTK
jgi:hypothetical protein